MANIQFQIPIDLEGWLKCHEIGKTPWHSYILNPMFSKYFEEHSDLLKPGKKLFVPLCGKDVVLSWVFRNLPGVKVVGLDGSPIACKAVFQENSIDFDMKEMPEIEGQLYQAKEGNLKVYCCDFFKFTKEIEKNFDVVWDKAALNAFDSDSQSKYVSTMKPLLSDTCVNLTEIVTQKGKTKPKATIEELKSYFGESYDVVHLDKIVKEDLNKFGEGFDKHLEELNYFKITKKQFKTE